MSDLIKKIKIKKQDGTFTDYIPIGADASNVADADGESVQLKLNKKPYYYNSIADMKADTKLKVGDMAITLGYYEANDGGRSEYRIISGVYTDDGGIYHKLNNNLYAELIIKDAITFKQFGPVGGNIDASIQLQRAIDYCCRYNLKLIIDDIYKINNRIDIDSPLQLEGWRSELSGFELTSQNAHFHIFNQGGLVYNQRWKNISIKCNDVAEYGIVGWISQCYFDNLYITHPTKACINIRSSLNWWNRCFFYYAPVAVEFSAKSECNQFIECNFWDNDVLFKPCGTIEEKARVFSLYIDNCWFEGFTSMFDHNDYVMVLSAYLNNTHLTPHITRRTENYIYKPLNPYSYDANANYRFELRASNTFFNWSENNTQTDSLIQLDAGTTGALISIENSKIDAPTTITSMINTDNIQVSKWLVKIGWPSAGSRAVSDQTKCVFTEPGNSYFGITNFYNGITIGNDIPCSTAELPVGQVQYNLDKNTLQIWNGTQWDPIITSNTRYNTLFSGNITTTSSSFTLSENRTNYNQLLVRVRNGSVITDTINIPNWTTKVISSGNAAVWEGEQRQILIEFTSETGFTAKCSGGVWTLEILGLN